MEPADGTGLLPLIFLLLGVGVWNFLRSLSGWFRSDFFPFFLNLPESIPHGAQIYPNIHTCRGVFLSWGT